MAINFPNDPATNPGDGGTWLDSDGNTWTVEIISGEAVWTLTEPADTGGGGGAVDSVNNQTGDVSLGIQDMNDYELNPPPGVVINRWATVTTGGGVADYNEPGEATLFFSGGGERCIVNDTDSDGADFSVQTAAAITANGGVGTNINIYVSRDSGATWTTHLAATVSPNYSGYSTFFVGLDPELEATTDELRISYQDPNQADTPLQEGDILQWVDADQKFKPSQIPDASSPLDGLLSVDGDAVKYDTAPTLGTDATDVVIPTMGQVRAAIASNGGTSVALNDLSDVTYTSGDLIVTGLTDISFEGDGKISDGNSNELTFTSTGLTSTGNFDSPLVSTNEVKIKNGSNHISLKAPTLGANVGFNLPATDGDAASVLTTDGLGNLTFQPIPAAEAPTPTFVVGFESTTSYKFTGPGLDGTELNPTLYVVRGQKYVFSNTLGAHPFQLQLAAGLGEAAYTDGVTGDQPIDLGSFEWEVQMDTPSTIFYQCTVHVSMAGTIKVLDNSGAGGGGGAVDSVNGQTGVVSLGIQDMNDYDDGTSDTFQAQTRQTTLETTFVLTAETNATEGGTTFTDESPLANGDATVAGTAGDVFTTAASAKFGNYGIRCTPDTSNFALQYAPNDAGDFGADEFTIEFWMMNTGDDRGNSTIISYGNTIGEGSQLSWIVENLGSADDLRFNWTTDGTFNGYEDFTCFTDFRANGVWSHYALVKGGFGGSGPVVTTEAFPANAGPITCDVVAITGNGSGGEVDIYTDGFGSFDFSEFTTPEKYGSGYAYGDEVAYVPKSGVGRATTTVTAHRFVTYQDGEVANDRIFTDTIYSGDATQCLTLFNYVRPNDTTYGKVGEGNFDEIRITKGMRYTGPFTPEEIVLGPDPSPGPGGPTQGDVMRWQNISQKYKPEPLATVAATGEYSDLLNAPNIATDAPVTSVNTETGDVSLGIQDMDDYGLGSSPPILTIDGFWSPWGSANTIGGWVQTGAAKIEVNAIDANGRDWSPEFDALVTNSNGVEVKANSFATTFDTVTVDTGDTKYYVLELDSGTNFGTGDLTVQVGTGLITPTPGTLDNGDVLAWNSTAGEFQPKALEYGDIANTPASKTRITPSVTTAALAVDSSETGEIAGTGATGFLLSCQTDVAAWIRIYCDSTSMTNDAGRDVDTDPVPGSGVLFEALYSTFTEKPITPGTTYFNLSGEDKLYYRITNKSAIAGTSITVTFKLLPVE